MGKEKITIVITGGKQQFGAYVKEIDRAFGAGDTYNDVVESIMESINLLASVDDDIRLVIDGREYEFIFDTSGALKYYSQFMSFSGLSRLTGINQRQLSNYANGYQNPNKETSANIIEKINTFGKELVNLRVER